MKSKSILKPIFLWGKICLFASISAFGQKHEAHIDSLIKIIPTYYAKPDSMLLKADELYRYAEKNGGARGMAFGEKFKGIGHYLRNDFEEAKKHYGRALKLYSQQKDTLEIAKALYNLAIVQNALFNYKETTENALRALKLFEKIEDPNGMGRIYNLLGVAAHVHEDYPKSVAYFKKYNHLVTLAGDSIEMSTSFNNLGGTYTEMNEVDSAILYLKKAEEINLKNNFAFNNGSVFQNLGNLYEKKGDIAKGIEFLQKGLASSEAEKNWLRASNIHYNLGRIYRKQNQIGAAESHLRNALEMAQQTGDKQILYVANEQMGYLNADRGKFAAAYGHLLDAKIYKDSVFQLEQKKIIEDLKAKYESEKKETEIQMLGQKNTIQSLQLRQRTNLLFLGGVVLLGLVGSGLFLIKQRKLKADALLQRKLKEKQEEATREVLEAEERERRRIAADLHDGVGQILSAALLNLREFDKDLKNTGIVRELALSNALELMHDSYSEMRNVSHQMMPNTLLKTGLANSIREFVQKLEHQHIQTHLDIVGLAERLDEQTETFLYRCIQEAVTNIIKHAHANFLSIQLIKDTDGISLTIEDNGRGFDTKVDSFEEGMGLKNIRSRVAVLGGDLEIDSSPGKGTVLLIRIP